MNDRYTAKELADIAAETAKSIRADARHWWKNARYSDIVRTLSEQTDLRDDEADAATRGTLARLNRIAQLQDALATEMAGASIWFHDMHGDIRNASTRQGKNAPDRVDIIVI